MFKGRLDVPSVEDEGRQQCNTNQQGDVAVQEQGENIL